MLFLGRNVSRDRIVAVQPETIKGRGRARRDGGGGRTRRRRRWRPNSAVEVGWRGRQPTRACHKLGKWDLGGPVLPLMVQWNLLNNPFVKMISSYISPHFRPFSRPLSLMAVEMPNEKSSFSKCLDAPVTLPLLVLPRDGQPKTSPRTRGVCAHNWTLEWRFVLHKDELLLPLTRGLLPIRETRARASDSAFLPWQIGHLSHVRTRSQTTVRFFFHFYSSTNSQTARITEKIGLRKESKGRHKSILIKTREKKKTFLSISMY